MKALKLFGYGVALLGLVACQSTTDEVEVRSTSHDLTVAQSRLLGFEAPTTDWSTTNGSTITSTTTVTQGSAALNIVPKGYTELKSVNMAAVGAPAAAKVTFDMLIPKSLPWGTAEVVFKAPSKGLNWTSLGTVNLAGSTANGYRNFSFNMPAAVKTVLEGNATDISFTFVINGPANAAYKLDNLGVGGNMGPPPPPPPPTPRTLSLTYPRGLAAGDMLISATRKVTIDDRSTLSRVGEHPFVASVGPDTSEFGADIDAFVDVTSQANVNFLRSQSHIYGNVTTAGVVNIQDASVVIDGAKTEHAAVSSLVTNFTVMWPAASTMTQVIYIDPDKPDLPISPGAYDKLRVGSRSTVTLRSGEYFFNSVVFEPQAHFRIDASRGPVRIYVQNELRLNVPLEYIGGRIGHVLFGYLGTIPASFEEYIVATVLAPNSAIELRRPASGYPHGGQFFGKDVHVFSDATVLHVPYPFDFVCPAGDSDKDGTFDCWDECPDDPKKTLPGVCNCGTLETDSDSDGAPDCIDQSKDDPGTTYVGQCGVKGVSAAPAGTRCTDGIQQGAKTCDGQGTCGDPNSDAPETGCKFVTYDNRAFWVCPGTPGGGSSQANALAKCAAKPGRALVRIDHRIENYLIASLARKVNASVRIGAVDVNGDGSWAWADKNGAESVQLWTGGPSGKAYHGMYNSWSSGAPGVSTSNKCAVIDASGAWTVDNCTTARPYVCEQTFGSARYPGGHIPEDEPLPTATPDDPVGPGCVDLPDPYDDAARMAMNAEINACDAACSAPGATDASCRAACAGAAAPPLSSTDVCGSTPGVKAKLDAFVAQNCSVDADCAGGGVGRVCGFSSVCYALEFVGGERVPIACTSDSDCARPGITGVCDLSRGLSRGQCLADGIDASCDLKSGNDCMAACVEARGCGVPPVTNNVDAFTGPCREVEYCSVQYSAPMENTDLTQGAPFDKSQLPDEAGLPAPAYPDDFAGLPPTDPRWNVCADSSAGCDRSERHPWCNYNATSPGAPTAGATDNKAGVRGKDSTALKVTFDPGADLKFETTPLPFGVSRFDALASVSATSNVKFKLLAFEGSVELLDLRADLEASICRVTTKGSRLALLGLDFLPAVAGDTGVLFDSDEIAGLSSEKCEKAIATYVDAVDRAKKALRDAQELVKQYKEKLPAQLRDVKTRADLPALGSLDPATLGSIHTFADDFCEDLLGPEDKRPPGMKGSCAQETDPSATINRFIEYYQQEAKSIDAVKKGLDVLDTKKLLGELVKKFPALASLSRALDDYSYAIDLAGLEDSSETTIISVQFFIGPIPALLEVGARVTYGVSGGFLVELQPKSLINGSGPIASAGATVTPHLGSEVTLFAGAGFSAGPLKLTLGLTAGLSLVNVELPASVKAGLNVNSSPETRLTIPANLTSLASSQGGMAYPFNGQRLKYDFSFRYDYGVNLTLNNILAGYLAATVKVKFFFFSLRYSQRLVDFKGLPPVSINLLGGGGPFVDTTPAPTPTDPEPRISGHFPDMVVSEQQAPWKATFEEVPFVNVEPLLPLADIIAALPAPAPVVKDAAFSRARVGDVLYNNECGCVPLDEPCTRNQDCCLDGASAGTVTCFADPATVGATSFCSECRESTTRAQLDAQNIANPVFESCNVPENCCDPDARCGIEPIPYNCRLVGGGGGFIGVWECDYKTPTTKVCLPALRNPWGPVR